MQGHLGDGSEWMFGHCEGAYQQTFHSCWDAASVENQCNIQVIPID